MAGYFPTDTWPPDLSRLSDEQRASFWVGCVVREDVALENSVRFMYEALAGRGANSEKVPRDIVPLIDGCIAMLESDGHEVYDQEITAISIEILNAARALHTNERNRVVHDYWYQADPERSKGFRRMRNAASLPPDPVPVERDIASFASCHEALVRMNFRVRTIASELETLATDAQWIADGLPSFTRYHDRARVMVVARDEFTVVSPGQITYVRQ